MPKLPPQKVRVALKILKKLKFKEIRQVGSHRRFENSNGRKVTIAIHTKDIPTGTMQSILDQAGLTVDQYLSLLKN